MKIKLGELQDNKVVTELITAGAFMGTFRLFEMALEGNGEIPIEIRDLMKEFIVEYENWVESLDDKEVELNE